MIKKFLLSTTRITPLMLLFVLIIVCVTKSNMNSCNVTSRMASIESLVERRTFIIDDSTFKTTEDRVFIKGHFYSEKPPILSVIGAAVYFPLYKLGMRLEKGPLSYAILTIMGPHNTYYLITLMTIGLGWLLCLFCFYHSLRFTTINEARRTDLTLALGIGTLFLPWSTVFNNHAAGASLLFFGFYFLLKARHLKNTKADLFLSGFFFSLAGTIDVPLILFYAGFLLDLLFDKDLRKELLFFCLPALITIIPAVVLNYSITHDFIPIAIHKEFFKYPGSAFQDGTTLTGVRINNGAFLKEYVFNCLVGNRGFYLYNPLLLISTFFLALEAIRKRPFYREARVVGLCSLIIIIYYLLASSNYAGSSYSIRWFVPLIPITFFFTHPFFEHMNTKKEAFFKVLLIISICIAAAGLVDPWSGAKKNDAPFITNIKHYYLRHILTGGPDGNIDHYPNVQ
jgi:hypothetical protein